MLWMSGRRVAITGLGLVTPLGIGLDTLWDGLMAGRSGVRPAEGFDPGDMPTNHFAQVPAIDFDERLEPRKAALWSMASRLSVYSGMLAAEDAGIKAHDLPPTRTGVILGTGYGCVYDFEEHFRRHFDKGWRRGKPVAVPKMMPSAPASQLAIHFGARGLNITVSTACSSGAIAAGLAAERIRSGELDACVTGGVDYIVNDSIASAWNALRVLSRVNDPTASRPFSADRQGLVLGEGAAILILEEWEAARARGAHIHAELAGVGATNDAVNIVGPDPKGEIEAIQMALAGAGITPDDIDYVNAHGTATVANDTNESLVLKEVFGERAYRIPVSSIKGHLGHTMGASGAIEIAATALALEHQRLPPTLHFTPGDPDCDLDYVPEGARDHEATYAMSNSFGFGGQNSVLVLKRATPSRRA